MASWKFPWLWNSFGAIGNNLSDGYQFGDLTLGYAGVSRDTDLSLANQASQILGEARTQYEEDRAHTEMREDTAYQRAVADMRKAGLNPYTIGASPAASSASNVGADIITNKIQILGYLLDLKNLDAKNRKITNDAIGNVLGILSKSK